MKLHMMKSISRILIFAILHLCWLTSYGYAEMIPTESAAQTQSQDDRQRILDLLNRQEIINELGKYGITKVEAVARINSLTDEEVTKIAGKLDALPNGAGAEDILYVLLLPFTFVLGVVGTAVGISFFLLDLAIVITGGHGGFSNLSPTIENSWKPFIWNIEAIGDDTEEVDETCDPAMQSCD
jgi:hypothetical protein